MLVTPQRPRPSFCAHTTSAHPRPSHAPPHSPSVYGMGMDKQMLEWAEQVQSWRKGLITFLGLPPKGWRLEEAVEKSTVSALPPEEAKAMEGATEEEREERLGELRREDAAARFLQTRLREVRGGGGVG